MNLITWQYHILYKDGHRGALDLPVTFFDAIRCAGPGEAIDNDIQDKYLRGSYEITDTMLWAGHRAIQLLDVVTAFPLIPDKFVENPDAYHYLGASLEADRFFGIVVTLRLADGTEVHIPGYGPTSTPVPFTATNTKGPFVDINGIFINTSHLQDVAIFDTGANSWGKVRDGWVPPVTHT